MPDCADDERFVRVAPTIVGADEWSDRFAVRAEASWCRSGHDMLKDFPISYGLHLGGRYFYVDDSVRTPDATQVRITGAGSISISKPPRRAPRGAVGPEILRFNRTGYNLGFLEFGVTAGYEASADGGEENLTFGGELRYGVNAVREGQLLPSVVLRIESVEPASSEVRDAAGILDDSDGYSRWGLLGYWNVPLALFWGRLDAFRLQAEASFFRANGLEEVLEDQGWDAGEHMSFTLRYRRPIPLVREIGVMSFYGTYSAGQRPTDFTGRDAFSAGVEIGGR